MSTTADVVVAAAFSRARSLFLSLSLSPVTADGELSPPWEIGDRSGLFITARDLSRPVQWSRKEGLRAKKACRRRSQRYSGVESSKHRALSKRQRAKYNPVGFTCELDERPL